MLDKNEWIRPWAGSDDEVTKMLDIKLIRENPDKIKEKNTPSADRSAEG